MLFEYPTKDDWNRIAVNLPLKKLSFRESDFRLKEDNSLDIFARNFELINWIINNLQCRISDVLRSYVFMIYYYEKGIPDKEWWISPGKKGQSVQWFPHFESRHYIIKEAFDYYADTFYYKLFSAWDNIGHLLNVYFKLDIPKPSFSKAYEKIEHVAPHLFNQLKLIHDDQYFKHAKKLRNDLTHNHRPTSPTSIGSNVNRVSNNAIALRVGEYTTSEMICDNALRALNLLAMTLECVKQIGP